jgi:flagellar biosynthesis/type III secretory pathway chaperone
LPLSHRTWQQGLAWRREQIRLRRRARLTAQIQTVIAEKDKLVAKIKRLRERRAAL